MHTFQNIHTFFLNNHGNCTKKVKYKVTNIDKWNFLFQKDVFECNNIRLPSS